MMPESPAGAVDPRLTATRYFALVTDGVLQSDDRVELLEGVVVAMAPQYPRHSAAVSRANSALRAIADRAAIRVQMPLVLGAHSVPEPDVAVVPGTDGDYDRLHPTTALLVIEVADTSLAQDRITKMRIYAAAGIPEAWIINLRDECIEIFSDPEPRSRTYRTTRVASRGARIDLVALPGGSIVVDELLPA